MSTNTEHFDIIIEPGRVEKEYFKDLWRYRELFFFLAWRDVLVRYKQAVFGILWALIRPLAMMLIFTFVFSRVANLESGEVPYFLFVLAAMLPWMLFANAVDNASYSLIQNPNLITKVYFPRMILPGSTIIVNLVDFLIALFILFLLMILFDTALSPAILLMPLFLFLATVLTLGVGFWLAALNVRFRDFKYLVPYMMQFGLYASPVGYGSKEVPDKWLALYMLNPIVGILEGFRYSLLGTPWSHLGVAVALSIVVSSTVLISGFVFFRRTEKTFADIV